MVVVCSWIHCDFTKCEPCCFAIPFLGVWVWIPRINLNRPKYSCGWLKLNSAVVAWDLSGWGKKESWCLNICVSSVGSNWLYIGLPGSKPGSAFFVRWKIHMPKCISPHYVVPACLWNTELTLSSLSTHPCHQILNYEVLFLLKFNFFTFSRRVICSKSWNYVFVM